MTDQSILTIGHSNHSIERFVMLLRESSVNAIADVRSAPVSKNVPAYNKDALVQTLRSEGIAYVFLGRELGGRPRNKALYSQGVADYEKMAAAPDFQRELDRVVDGAARYRIALMCSEQDPLECHRCLLVARRLCEQGRRVGHILPAGSIASHFDIEERLLSLEGLSANDFFSRESRLADAYRARGLKVAYEERPSGQAPSVAAE
jgi:uncharacterized protein (DUF488 family)